MCESPVKDVQRSFDPSIREGLVSSAADIQSFYVTDSKQPVADPATVPRVVPFVRRCAQHLIAAAPSSFNFEQNQYDFRTRNEPYPSD